ncbi:MAG TPA: HD domain-containing protein [Clostridiaceae bacterium]|nr:HD domain-containing protein [Clostridiaceae bacterium]
MVLTVAALHDVLEGCDKYSYDNIKEYFGEDIANAVNLLTKSDGQDVGEYLKRIDDSEYSSWLMIVKLADRLHNLRCLKSTNNKDKIQRKSLETRKYFIDYAKRYNEYLYNQISKELEKLEIED